MKTSGISYSELRELLTSLGFSEQVEPARIAFVLPGTPTYLLFGRYSPKDKVTDRDMLVVRRQLVDNGLIEASALDKLLNKVSA